MVKVALMILFVLCSLLAMGEACPGSGPGSGPGLPFPFLRKLFILFLKIDINKENLEYFKIV